MTKQLTKKQLLEQREQLINTIKNIKDLVDDGHMDSAPAIAEYCDDVLYEVEVASAWRNQGKARR